MKHTLFTLLFALLFAGNAFAADLTKYVDPRIGTGGHGHVFMGANVPFGLVQLGPTSIPTSWDWTSGYHVSDTTVIGFSHLHLSGTGCNDLGDVTFMPVVGEVTLARGTEKEPDSGLWSYFSHASEIAKPGYYKTFLDRYKIGVELTATKRVGLHKYTFPQAQDASVVIDLANGNGDSTVESYIVQDNDTVVSGYRHSKGWADNQWIYFTATFSKPIKKFVVSKGNERQSGTLLKSKKTYGLVYFDTNAGEEIYVKVALSPTGIPNAKWNLSQELPASPNNATFQQTIANAGKAWNAELNKIQIKTTNETTQRIFYTALYHTMIAPSEFCDVSIHPSFINYTTLSLWDTYRAAHPLMTLIHPEKMSSIVNTFLGIYKKQGKLPVWHLMGCETNCMVGNPAIPVVADAILKGYGGFDVNLAYEAMRTSAMLDERGLKYLKEYGFIPYDKEGEGLSKAMEYGIADWALAQVALKLGKTDDYNTFLQRSKAYQYYFDKETGFMRGLSSEGTFRSGPFNPFQAIHRENDYTEGNAWQYTWLVPHDVDGLVQLFGSKEKFISKLDSLFIVEGDLGKDASPDISGLIGQYAHGNEPSHHIIYMYPYVGQAWKTQEKVREVLETMYTGQPDGLSGNEDVGQMSAWYILSAMGLYQVEPAGGKYILGSPVLDEAILNVGNGKTFTIVAKNNSVHNKYVQKVFLNGKRYDNYYVDFADIAAGGKLEFVMGSKR
ncbi:MAG: GH92 family glycosyl hydrolase [Candidatus Symbiothrix sp.]|jgi:predicted alpha-1,2-mannosidase|nr:GH92 family glycosyl hydrolase [Candidatus Symbiothrix sp.]